MNNDKILLKEHNVISLRTAVVIDDGSVVCFQLPPAPSLIPTRQNVYKDEYMEWLNSFLTFLYQHIPPASGEKALKNIRQLAFEKPPELKLLWTDSGNSVAVYLNGEPWAFIDENTQKAYSKGVLNSGGGTPWDQEVFEKTFVNGG